MEFVVIARYQVRAGEEAFRSSSSSPASASPPVASCVRQATGAGAAGIITDAIPYGMAENALNAAKAKGIPIIITGQIPPSGRPTPAR
jgi:ribose transport system substrate-binding protein